MKRDDDKQDEGNQPTCKHNRSSTRKRTRFSSFFNAERLVVITSFEIKANDRTET
jgi:hypothetical protein